MNIDIESDLVKFGMGLFETIKIKEEPIYLNCHLDRLFKSINDLELNFKIEKEFLKKEIINYINLNNIKNKAFRVTVYDKGYFFSIRDINYTIKIYNEGFSLTISPIKRCESIINKHKTTNCFENIYSKKFANSNGFDDAIFLNHKNNILETSISNIFFIKKNKIFTPQNNLYFLDGIIRKKIIKLCKINNIDLIETNINIDNINEFEFCFISNSLLDIIRVSKIDYVNFNKKNKIFDTLKTLLEKDYEKQDL